MDGRRKSPTPQVEYRRCASLCLDFQNDGDYDFITFDGCHALERNLNRSPLRPGIQSVESVRGTSAGSSDQSRRGSIS